VARTAEALYRKHHLSYAKTTLPSGSSSAVLKAYLGSMWECAKPPEKEDFEAHARIDEGRYAREKKTYDEAQPYRDDEDNHSERAGWGVGMIRRDTKTNGTKTS